jgi:hypothetical protein
MPELHVEIDGEKHVIEFSAYCDRCGGFMCYNVIESSAWWHGYEVRVEPCQRCLDAEYEAGHRHGTKEAQD